MALPRSGRTAAVGFLVAAALALRLFRLDASSLWLDECYSLRDASDIVPFNRMRPVYYLFLRLWLLLGESDAWARLPSAVFGAASVHLLYRLARHLAGTAVGLVAGALLALSPLAIDQSQQVRMYELGALLGLFGSLALSRALDAPSSRAVPLWAAARLLVAATAPLNVTLLAADAVLVARHARGRPEFLARFLRWSALALLWAPLVALTARDPGLPLALEWLPIVPRPGPEAVVSKLLSFTTAWPTSVPRFPGEAAILGNFIFALLLGALIVVAFGAQSPWRISRATTWALVPLALLFLASLGPRSLWLDRYLYFASPYVLILVAAGFVRIWEAQRALAVAAALAYAAALVPALAAYYRDPGREDWRGVAQAIAARERPGDRIVVHREFCLSALRRYYRGPARLSGLHLDLISPTEAQAREAVRRLAAAPGRAFIVYWHFGTEERHADFRRAVSETLPVLWKQSFQRIDLYLVRGSPGDDAVADAGSVSAQRASGAR